MGNVCVKFRLNLFSRSGEEDFLKKNSQNKMAAEPSDLWRHNFFSYGELLCRWGSRNFRFFLCSVVPNEFWPADLLTDDLTKNHPCSPWGASSNAWSEIFFHRTVSEIRRSKVFRFFQDGARTTWPMTSQLPLKFAIKKDTYYGENFVSIGLTVAEKMIFKAKRDANLRRKNNNKE